MTDEQKKTYTLEEIKEMRDVLMMQEGAKNDPFSTTPSVQSLYGRNPGNNAQGGVFSGVGVRPGMWNATVRVRTFATELPFVKTRTYNEIFEIMTGVTDGSGNNSTNACAAAPQPGVMKKMRQVFTYGMIHIDSRVADITQAGMYENRAVVDREMWNNASVMNPLLPQVPGIEGDGIAASELRAAFYPVGIELERNVTKVNFVGVSGTENNTYRGVARQWNGLDSLIKTGYTDADTGLAAPIVDSQVVSFNAAVTGTDSFGRTVVEALTDTMWAARETGMTIAGQSADYMLVMRGDLFRSLTDRFAEQYTGYRITGSSSKPVGAELMALQMLRMEMQRGYYLPIDGIDYPVVVDDSITREVTANNTYKSDVYIVAKSFLGRPTAWFEYFDMANSSAEELANAVGMQGAETTTVNDGLYRVFKLNQGGCYQYKFVARPRLILDAPFLHARLDDVIYTSYMRQRDPIPGMSYYANGGISYNTP